jgi:hypothetical protein
MLIPVSIAKQITFGIIAPHGITDLIHARQTGLMKPLVGIQAGTLLSVYGLHSAHMDILVNVLFLIASVAHFRHDMVALVRAPLWFRVVVLSAIPQVCLYDSFLLYMVLLHVPNHYRMNWSYIRNQKWVSGLLVGGFTLGSLAFAQTHGLDSTGGFVMDTFKALIISHVIYNERYVLVGNGDPSV